MLSAAVLASKQARPTFFVPTEKDGIELVRNQKTANHILPIWSLSTSYTNLTKHHKSVSGPDVFSCYNFEASKCL